MNTNTRIRTRFAPSPTGDLHIGGARTALFAYLWAKKNNGDFILRIEDTDQERSQKGSLTSITEGLRWLGLEWDEGPGIGGDKGPYFQSERLEIYNKHLQTLVDNKKAYYCFCTRERLDAMRKTQQENKLPPRYDRTCRRLAEKEIQKKLNENIEHVVRLAVPEEGSVEVHDLLRGKVIFNAKDIDDQILMKSDGFPTYHLANVIDDHLMEISHVIRGEEWLPSLPKHILLYDAFKWEAPLFVHLSLFLAKGGGKVSKRQGAMGIFAFRDQGYLVESLLNFCALLGWNPKSEEEFFTLDELIKKFTLENINTSNPIFETEKLEWMNQHYIRKLSAKDILRRIKNLKPLEGKETYTAFIAWFETLEKIRQESIWNALAERSKKLTELPAIMQWLNTPTIKEEELIWKKSTKEDTLQALTAVREHLAHYNENEFIRAEQEQSTIDWIAASEWGNGDILWPVRMALSGKKQSPSPFELMEILGKEETLKRIDYAISLLKK